MALPLTVVRAGAVGGRGIDGKGAAFGVRRHLVPRVDRDRAAGSALDVERVLDARNLFAALVLRKGPGSQTEALGRVRLAQPEGLPPCD